MRPVTPNSKNNIVTKSMLSLCIALSLPASAEQITFIGKVKTELPRVIITNSPDPVSDVKNFTLSVSPTAGICSIEANPNNAKNHGTNPICLITWDDPKGLAAHLRGLRGVIKGHGNHTFTYTLSMFDKDKFELLSEDKYSVTFSEPVEPSKPSLVSFWQIKPESSELEHSIFNRNERHTSVAFSIEPRNFDQKIEFGPYSCVIPEGRTNCTISVSEKFNDKDTQGEKAFAFRSTDTFGHFDGDKSDFKYVWDFRPPLIESIHVNSNDSRLPKVITEYGETLVLLHDQAAVIVKSPHVNIEDDWWLPTDPTLRIVPSRSLNITNALSINNTNVTFNIGTTSQSTYLASPIARPVRIGEYLAYVYDFSEINDGLYNFNFSTEDRNGNGELKTIEDVYVDRFPPDIQFVVNNRHHRSKAPAHAFSLSDITVAAWGGWEDGSKIVSAKINDEPIDFAGGTDLIKRLKNIDLPLASLNTLEVTAEDKTGNTVTRTLDFHYGVYDFKTYSTKAMAQVQQTQVYLESLKGASCIAATSEELAQLYSQINTSLLRGCTIEWIQRPDGLSPSSLSSLTSKRLLVASGVIQSPGVHPYSFNVHQFDAFGDSKLIYRASGEIETLPIQAPRVTVGMSHIAQNFPEDYKYKLPQERKLTIPTSVHHAPMSEIVVQLRDQNGNVVESREYQSSRASTIMTFSTDTTYAPLSSNHYSVRAFYKVNPAVYSERPYHFFVTPPTMMRLSLTHPQVAVQGTTLPVTAQVGLITQNGLTYSPSMGEWEVHLSKLDTSTNKLVPLTQNELIDTTGKVNLSITADELLASNNRVFAIAKLKTSYPEVDMSLRASSLFSVPVLTTGNISVQLSASQVSNPVPANFLVRLNFETTSDRLSTDTIVWQQSSDANTWETIDAAQNQQTAFIQLPTAQERYVRAAIKHKLSDSLAYTNTIKLTAYEEAVLTLTGDRRVMAGAMGTYQFEVNSYALSNSSSDVEWTLDNGNTWNVMSPTDQAEIPTTMDISARLLIAPEGVEPYYVYDKITVQHIDPKPLSPILTVSDRRAEIGDTVTISARFSSADSATSNHHRYHFITPTGEYVDTLTLTRLLTENDFSNQRANFIFRSWLDGQQLQTITTREISIAQLIYQFPNPELVVLNPERVVQSNINLSFKKPMASSLPKRVVIREEFILPPELELIRHSERSAVLVANRAGLHPFTVRFYDNRGNEREQTAFVDIHNPEDMSIRLITDLQGKHIRPPIRLVSRVTSRPGSPRDKVSSINWFLNDEPVSDSLATTHRSIIQEPGDHVLRVAVETVFGQTAEETFSFTVNENKKPYCEPFWEARDRTLTLNPNCMDDDGRILRIDATYNINATDERTVTRFSVHQITFVSGMYSTHRPVQLVVLDDSDEEITLTVPWPNE